MLLQALPRCHIFVCMQTCQGPLSSRHMFMYRQHLAPIMRLCMRGQPLSGNRAGCACEAGMRVLRIDCCRWDYAAAGIFINITTDSEEGHSAPWWQLEGARMAPGLEPLTPVCSCPMIFHAL